VIFRFRDYSWIPATRRVIITDIQFAELGLELETKPGVSSLHKAIFTGSRDINAQNINF
jgi:hypothetical protein